MIKVIDQKGEVHEINESLWNSLSKMANCKFRLAEIPIPKEVVEFKPTPKANEVEKLIAEKECCNENCKKEVPEVIEVTKPKGGRPPKKK